MLKLCEGQSVSRVAYTAFSILAVALVAATLFARDGGAAEAPPLPDKPSVVVLPFADLNNDSDDTYLVDGVRDVLITDLSSVTGILSIARNSSVHYRDRKIEPLMISRELGVRWLVMGTVEKVGNVFRFMVRLIDGPTGKETWSRTYNRPHEEMLALSQQLRSQLLETIQVELTESEKANFRQPETNNAAAFDAYLKGLYHYHRMTPADFAIALPELKNAVEMDPGYSRAHSVLAALYIHAWRSAWHVALGFKYGERARPRELAEAHIDASMLRPTALALRWKARLLTFNSRAFDQATAYARMAIAVEPGSPEGYIGLNYILGYMHELDEAERVLRIAIRLDPHHPPYAARLAWIDYYKGDFETAAVRLRKAISREPDSYIYYVSLISALGHLGRIDEATNAIAEMQAIRARLGMTPVLLYYLRYWPFKNESDRDLMREGLQKAGLRD